ncbi:MAG: hypothetical protein IJK04_16520 [Kiritimatiellae bacterium]|nr:hypothetical protein [Kiritimatiellia bacterium]
MIIRRDPIHLFYLFDMMKHPRIEPFFRDAISGKALNSETDVEAFNFFKALGLFCKDGTKWFFFKPDICSLMGKTKWAIECSQFSIETIVHK